MSRELSKRNEEAQLETLTTSDISDVGKRMLGRLPQGRSLTTPYQTIHTHRSNTDTLKQARL